MFNKIVKISFIFLIISVLIIASLPCSVSAVVGEVLTMPMSQPAINDNSGYIEVFLRNVNNGVTWGRVMQWNIYPKIKTDGSKETEDCWMNINISNNVITFTPSLGYADTDGIYAYGYMWTNGEYGYESGSFTGSTSFSWSNANYEIIGYRCYGNFGFVHSDVNTSAYGDYSILYSESNASYSQLLEIIALIRLLEDDTDFISTTLHAIFNNTDTIESKLQSALTLLSTIETDLDDVNAELDSIDSELDEIDLKLQSIIDILSSQEPQPDFESTDSAIEDTTNQMNNLESDYKINQSETNSALSLGTSFVSGTDMQAASIQVKNWIERVFNDNSVYGGFILAALGLGVCFWVIGRKGWG